MTDKPTSVAISVALVEDDHDLRSSLVSLLKKAPGLQVVADYPDAETALADLGRRRPDVVLMDVNLPALNGVECVRRLKPLLPATQVLMLTVHDDNDSLFDSILAGADGYLLKDTVPSQLVAAIREVHRGGSPMTPEIARRVVQHFRKSAAIRAEVEGLTPRELEVLELLARGHRYKEISDSLGITMDGIRFHIRRIYDKLHVHSRTEAVLRFLGR